MSEPLFTDTVQVAVVVKDLDATMSTYFNDYGIGPFQVYEMHEDAIDDLTLNGKPAKYEMRMALANVGHVQFELIQPLDDKSDYSRFLAEKGEGVHHLSFAVRDYKGALDALREKGHHVVMSGEYVGIPYSYMSTDRDLGFITEIVDWPTDGRKATPDSVYPSEAG